MTPEQLLYSMIGQFKKGVMTSEFWIVVASVVYTAVMQAYDPSRPFSEQAINIAIVAGSALYAFGRSYLKGKRVEAVASVSTGQKPGDSSKTIQIDEDPAEPTDTDTPVPPDAPANQF